MGEGASLDLDLMKVVRVGVENAEVFPVFCKIICFELWKFNNTLGNSSGKSLRCSLTMVAPE